MSNNKLYSKIAINYSIIMEEREVNIKVYALNISNDDISACNWTVDEISKKALSVVTRDNWYMIEESFGHGINDNFEDSLPHTEIRLFTIDEDGSYTLCDESKAIVTAKVVIEEC